MLAVVLAGLKWFGIVLLIIVGLFLLVCLSVLLIPVRYKLQITIDDKRRVYGTVSWLLHLVHISFQSGEDGSKYCIRVLGICLTPRKKRKRRAGKGSGRKKRKGKKRRADAKQQEKERQGSMDAGQQEKEKQGSIDAGHQKKDAEHTDAFPEKGMLQEQNRGFISRLFGQIRDFVLSIAEIFGKIRRKVQDFFEKKESDEESQGGISRVLAILRDENTPEVFRLLRENAGGVIRHIRPSRVKGWIRFGTDDPCLTGQLLGGVGILFAARGHAVTVIPDFEETVLEGDLKIYGRIRFAVLLFILSRLHPLRQWNHYKKYSSNEK